MRIKVISCLICGMMFSFFFIVGLPTMVSATTIIVPDHYLTIQDALDAANPGDTIYVRSGIYYEHLTIDKALTLQGEDRDSTIINGGNSGTVISVIADGVHITGFTITEGGQTSSGGGGVWLDKVFNCKIIDNNILSNNGYGIWLKWSSNINISDNKVYSNKGYGISIWSWSTNNVISNNSIYNNEYGLYGGLSNSYIIGNNISSNNYYGIWIDLSLNNNISNNNISNNGRGFYLSSSSYNNITNNNFVNNGIFIRGYQLSHYISHNIPPNNIVNGKTLLYYKDLRATDIIGIPIGQLILVNCSDLNVRNLQINNTEVGIELAYSWNISMAFNNISSNIYGIYLYSSPDINISGNNISNNLFGIWLDSSSNDIIMDNKVISNNLYGMYISFSSNSNIIKYNDLSNNNWGISLTYSSNNNITNNNFLNDGIFIDGYQLSHFNSHNIPTNNIVNGVPLYYYKNCSGLNINGQSIGQLILANCTDINVNNLHINNTYVGIEIAYSTNISIGDNNIFQNFYGIHLIGSSDISIIGNNVSNNRKGVNVYGLSHHNIIARNVISSNSDEGVRISHSSNNVIEGNNVRNNGYGVYLYSLSANNIITKNYVSNNEYGIYLHFISFSGNRIYHNNIINNLIQAYDDSNNQWDNDYPSGGNYWSDYSGMDYYSGVNQNIPGSDGIGDTPYVFNYGRDNYPLCSPWTSTIQTTINIDPDTLNLKSKGRWITCYITLPDDLDVNDIDISTVMLEDTIPAKWGDIQGDTLMVKFDRSDVEDMLSPGTYNLKVSGELMDGTLFEGYSDEIRVIEPV